MRGGVFIRWLALAAVIALTAAANILMKYAARHLAAGIDWKQRLLQPPLLAALACFALGLLLYSYTLAKLDLSVAYPVMSGLVLVLVVTFSIAILGEKPLWARVTGTALILAGIVLVTRSG